MCVEFEIIWKANNFWKYFMILDRVIQKSKFGKFLEEKIWKTGKKSTRLCYIAGDRYNGS